MTCMNAFLSGPALPDIAAIKILSFPQRPEGLHGIESASRIASGVRS